jgi:hypothetical protein
MGYYHQVNHVTLNQQENIMSDFITIKAASNLFNVPVMTLHWALRNNKIDGVHAGTGGDSKASRLDGRLVYHNLVSVSSVIKWQSTRLKSGVL